MTRIVSHILSEYNFLELLPHFSVLSIWSYFFIAYFISNYKGFKNFLIKFIFCK